MDNKSTSKERSKSKALIRIIKDNQRQGLIIYFKQNRNRVEGEYHINIDQPAMMAHYLRAVATKSPEVNAVLLELYKMAAMEIQQEVNRNHKDHGKTSKGQSSDSNNQGSV